MNEPNDLMKNNTMKLNPHMLVQLKQALKQPKTPSDLEASTVYK